MFVSGGVSGFFLAQPSIDIMLHATYFVVGHFHMVMGVAAMFGIFAGTYFWFPKMYGRMMNETLGKVHFWLRSSAPTASSCRSTILGLAGNVRRYQAFVDDYLQPLIPVHKFITYRRAGHRRSAIYLPVQPDPQPFLGQTGAGTIRGKRLRWSGARRHAAAVR